MTPPEAEGQGALDVLSATLNTLHTAITDLADDVPAALDVDDTTEAVVSLLHDLREQRKALAQMEAYVEAAAVKRLKYGQQQVGEFIAEVKGGKDRRAWQHDDLAWAVCRPLAVNENTGEVVTEIAEIIDQVRARLLNCAAVSYWRTTQLKPLGINPDDYSESTPGRRTVTVTSAIEAEPATDRVAS